jgi:hypothetical protein
MPLSGLLGRVAYAALMGVLAFLLFFIIGVVVKHYEQEIGLKLEVFSPLIGLLVGIVVFFLKPTPTIP